MGSTYVRVEMQDLAQQGKAFETNCLVDTGATDCLAPTHLLQQAGVRPEGYAVYEIANSEAVKYPFGFARIRFAGCETVAQVIFGPDNIEPILGVVALENTGMTVDPISKTLKRAGSRPLKSL